MDMRAYIEAILNDKIEIKEGTPTRYAKHAMDIGRRFFLKNPTTYSPAKENPPKLFNEWVLAINLTDAINPAQRIAELEEEMRKSRVNQTVKFSLHRVLAIVINYCLVAIRAEADQIFEIAWMNACEAMYWAGYLNSGASITFTELSKAAFAKLGAKAKHASDPTQADKALIKEHWENWQMNPGLYATKISFARSMYRIYDNVLSLDTIKRWEREWRKEKNSNKS